MYAVIFIPAHTYNGIIYRQRFSVKRMCTEEILKTMANGRCL